MQAHIHSRQLVAWRWAARLALFGALVAATACNPYRCTYETRFVSTAGTASATPGTLKVEDVNMREYRDGPVSNAIIWSITAEGLSAPPTRLTLRNEFDVVVATLSMSSSSTVSMTANGSLDTPDGDARFALLASGKGRVVLELQNGERITAVLAVSQEEHWHHPNC